MLVVPRASAPGSFSAIMPGHHHCHCQEGVDQVQDRPLFRRRVRFASLRLGLGAQGEG